MVKRAPVLTLWAAVVAEVLGLEHDEALTLGRAVAGLNAYSKGVSLGPGTRLVGDRDVGSNATYVGKGDPLKYFN
jgi:hypothetical protein